MDTPRTQSQARLKRWSYVAFTSTAVFAVLAIVAAGFGQAFPDGFAFVVLFAAIAIGTVLRTRADPWNVRPRGFDGDAEETDGGG